MARKRKKGFWHKVRVYFRHFRISVWLVVLTLLCAALYLNQIGLPEFIKNPLLDTLRARGLDFQFSRLRIRWYEGIVADNVRFDRSQEDFGPSITADQVKLQLNMRALLHRQLQVDGIQIRHGRVRWLLPDNNQPPRQLSIDNIQTQLRFLPGDEWRLDGLRAAFAGGRIYADGTVLNASAVREWNVGAQGAATNRPLFRERLTRLSETLDRIRFDQPPELALRFSGDAKDLRSFGAQLSVTAPGADTPWGRLSKGQFDLRLTPADTNGLSTAEVRLKTESAETRWASGTKLSLLLNLKAEAANTNLVDASLELSAAQSLAYWTNGVTGKAESVEGRDTFLKAQWTQSITNAVPISGQAKLLNRVVVTPQGSARGLALDLDFARLQPVLEPSLVWWTNLQPYRVGWTCDLSQVKAEGAELAKLSLGGSWDSPRLTVTNLVAQGYGGQLQLEGSLDVESRLARALVKSDLEPHQLESLLPEAARKLLNDLSWGEAPRLRGSVQATLPPWRAMAEDRADWQGEVRPTLSIDADFALPKGAVYRGIEANSVKTHFSYSNLTLRLSDLVVIRPEGVLAGSHTINERTGEFVSQVHSQIDPTIIRGLLKPEQQGVFELLSLSSPPVIAAEIRGRLPQLETIGGRAHVVVSNFAFRSQTASFLEADMEYTNELLKVSSLKLDRGKEQIRADALTVDFKQELIFVTNGYSTADPVAVTRAIGPKIARAVEPYQFGEPPVARVYGTIPMRGEEQADLHFDVEGGPFHWWRFDLPRVSGHVHWAGLHLSLSNVQAEFYGGRAVAAAGFDFTPGGPTTFRFGANATNCLLPAVIAGVFSHPNKVEGRLDANVVVTSAITEDWRSVQGSGELRLRDGLIWDLPLFGIFSPVLDGIVPGLGSSRATAATCTYVMTNGVAFSDDLDVRATGMRLAYRGTVDLENHVQARMEAELFRDMWVVGPVVSSVLWPVTKMFEYRVNGTLVEPRVEPVYILPKMVMLPFTPFRLLKGLVPGAFPGGYQRPAEIGLSLPLGFAED